MNDTREYFTEEEAVEATRAERSIAQKTGKTLKLAMLLAVVLAVGFAGGVRVGAAGTASVFSNVPLLGASLNATPDPSLDFTDFWKVYNILNSRFVQTHGTSTPSTSDARLWGAIQGLTASYGDPYTVFFPPDEAKIFNEQIAGNFSGVGMEVGKNKDGVLTVIAPLKGTPAERAGIRAGDLIRSIQGTSTNGLSVDEAVKLIRGPKGTVVKFGLYRDGKPLEIPVTRDTIQVPTIEATLDEKTGVFTIALYEFSGTSESLFASAIADFRRSGSDRLIVDLRGNPGGYLEAAVRIASHFLPKGTPIVIEDYQGKEPNVIHRSRGINDVPSNVKIVVLMDQGSASASEIFAGALQDNDRAVIIGTRSFGKGSVQELIEVGGAALKVTIARWLTPSGASISDGGLTPDIQAARTQEDVTAKKDPQMDRAVEYLRTGK